MSSHLVTMATSGDIGTLIDGIAPDWGPFGALGETARTVVEAIMAGVILALFGRAALGAFNIRVGESQHDVAQVSKGKRELGGALIGVFIVGSLATIFTIVYGMGI